MAVVIVNDKPVDIGSDRLNLIEAALRAGVEIPYYCWHPALTVVASCRMCLVEVGEKKPDGTIAMQPKVVPACQTPAKDGTVVVTHTGRAKEAQARTLESLLLNHPLDCPVCDKAGECKLQDYSFGYGHAQSRMIDTKNHPPNKPHISPSVTLFADRCVMCSRCVRFTREIAGTAELQVIHRGSHAEIDVFPGKPLDNKLSGNVVDICPVGALCSKDFLYKQRVWNLKHGESVCAGCSTGCSIYLDHNKDIVYRLRPRFNPLAQGHFMCDEGRWGYHYTNSADRLLRPQGRRETGLSPTTWTALLPALRRDLADAAKADGSSVLVVLSPFLTVEEAYLLAKYFKGLSGGVKLALGPIPSAGADDTFPKDRRGNPIQPVKFTIRAEKCPNRVGVEAILRQYQKAIMPFTEAVAQAREGRFKAAFLTAGYPTAGTWLTAEDAAAFTAIKLLVVQDLFPSAASSGAKFVLPAAAFSEKEGTFVNHAGLAQTIHKLCKPPQEARSEGQVACELAERRGLFHLPTVRAELARDVPFFAPLGGTVSEYGVKLG